VNWTEGGGEVSTSASYTFTASADRALVANFTPRYTITTSANPVAGGNTSGGGTYNSGASVTVSATANAGYVFVNWTEGGGEVSTSASYTFTASADRALVANFTPNAPPRATNPALAAVRNQAVTFSAAKLATDPDGDPVTFGVSPSSQNGGTVSLLAGLVTYAPPADYTGSDSFSYTVSDGRGGTANGTVTVTVSTGLAVSLNVVYGPVVNEGQFVVRFAGVPGCAYTLESSTDLTSWVKVTNLVAPSTDQGWGVGVCQYSGPASDAQGYYRTVDPAY